MIINDYEQQKVMDFLNTIPYEVIKSHFLNSVNKARDYDNLFQMFEGVNKDETETYVKEFMIDSCNSLAEVKELLEPKKEILERGYLTHALTNESGDIYGLTMNHHINWEVYDRNHNFYWSEVYCETGYMAVIIRKGMLLPNPTPKELQYFFEKSKVNLN